MKVIITDKRETPRVIYIDGKGYVLPSNRPITMNISDRAKTILDRTEFIQVIKSEMKASDNRKSSVSDKELLAPEPSQEQETIDKKVEDEKKEDNEVQEPVVTRQAPVSNKVEKSEPVIEEQENNEPTIEEQEEVKEESQEEEVKEESQEEEIKEESQEEEIKEEKPDYSSMLVRELKEILDARGVDYKGWLKKDMVEYLENN